MKKQDVVAVKTKQATPKRLSPATQQKIMKRAAAAYNEARKHAETLSGFVIASNRVGDKTVTNLVGGSCGTRFPFQFDTVWPLLFPTADAAHLYVKGLEIEAGRSIDAVVVSIEHLIVDVEQTREFAAWHAELRAKSDAEEAAAATAATTGTADVTEDCPF